MPFVKWAYIAVKISSLVVFLPVAIALVRWRKLQYPTQYFLAWHSLFVLLTAGIMFYVGQVIGKNNLFWTHYVPTFETAFYLGMFSPLIASKKRWGLFSFVLICSVLGTLFFYELTERNNLALIGETIVVVGMAIYFLAKEMQADALQDWWYRPLVLIALANLTYYSCMIVHYLLFNWLVSVNYIETLMKLSGVHAIFSILHILLLAAALWIPQSQPSPNRPYSISR